MDISINYLAVLVAGVSNMIIGSVWYGPLFGKRWMHLSGQTHADMESAKAKGMAKLYLWAMIAALVMAYVLSHFILYFDATSVGRALQLAFWAWLGFIATTTLDSVLWENKSKELYALNVGYRLVSLGVMAVILALGTRE